MHTHTYNYIHVQFTKQNTCMSCMRYLIQNWLLVQHECLIQLLSTCNFQQTLILVSHIHVYIMVLYLAYNRLPLLFPMPLQCIYMYMCGYYYIHSCSFILFVCTCVLLAYTMLCIYIVPMLEVVAVFSISVCVCVCVPGVGPL